SSFFPRPKSGQLYFFHWDLAANHFVQGFNYLIHAESRLVTPPQFAPEKGENLRGIEQSGNVQRIKRCASRPKVLQTFLQYSVAVKVKQLLLYRFCIEVFR